MSSCPSLERRWRRCSPVALLPLLALAGCDDGGVIAPERTGVCAPALACQVAGPDLVVAEPEVLWPDDQPIDEITGYRVVQPGDSLRVEMRIWNRGDAPTAAAPFSLGSRGEADWRDGVVPALDPGAVFVDTLRVEAATFLYYLRDTTLVSLYVTPAQHAEDPLLANNSAESVPFHVALPVLVAEVGVADSLRIGESHAVELTIRNVSRHAELPAGQVYYCWFSYDSGCGAGMIGEPFGITPREAIAPEGEWTWSGDVHVPVTSSYWDESRSWWMYACIAQAGATPLQISEYLHGWTCLDQGVEIRALPNLELTCDVALIAADTTVASSDVAECVESEFHRFRVFRVDADANAAYEVDLTGPGFSLAAIDHEGTRIDEWQGISDSTQTWSFGVPEAGPVYLLGYGEFTLDLRRP